MSAGTPVLPGTSWLDERQAAMHRARKGRQVTRGHARRAAGRHDRTEPVDIQVEMQRSYIDYAMSRHRRPRAARRAGRAQAGAPPRSCTRCTTAGSGPTAATSSAPASSATSWATTTRTATRAIYDALVRLAQPWSLRYPLVDGQGNFGSPGNDPPAAMRYTECRLAPLAMEMLRDIDEETVDFRPELRRPRPGAGGAAQPVPQPAGQRLARASRSAWPPTSRRTTCARSPPAVQWCLENFEAADEELLDALMERVKGPDFPTRGLIVGRRGIEDAYRTGRGSIRMRAVVEVEEDARGRTCLVVTELPYQVNPDNLVASRSPSWSGTAGSAGIADIRDETQRPDRPAPRHRAQARRGRQGRAEQPLQAHPAAGHASARTCWRSSTACRARCAWTR